MDTLLTYVLFGSLIVHLLLALVCLWRLWRGENVIDRLTAADLMTTLTLSMLLLIALILKDGIYIDVAIGLAALGYISTLAMAKYLADRQMF